MWKRDQSVTPPPAGRDQSAKGAPAGNQSTETLVMDLGKSMVIKGELSGSEDLTLYGQMEGSIRLPDRLFPSPARTTKPSASASGNPTTATEKERHGEQSRHNRGYDEAADGPAVPEIARVGDE